MHDDKRPTSEYCTTAALAQWTDSSERLWAEMRERGDGPPYVRIGRLVRYRLADVIAWLDAQRVGA